VRIAYFLQQMIKCWDKGSDVTDPKYVFYIWKGGEYAEIGPIENVWRLAGRQ